jgi:hypothetical protein
VDAFATPDLSARLLVDADTFDDVQDAQLLLAWERAPGTAVFVGGGVSWAEAALASWSVLAKLSWGFAL